MFGTRCYKSSIQVSGVKDCVDTSSRDGANALKELYLNLSGNGSDRFRHLIRSQDTERMMNKRTTSYAFVLLSLGLALAPLAHAGIVSQTTFVKASMLKKIAVKQQRSHLEVLLDLSGYRDATVSFDFATLMRGNGAGFRLASAPNRFDGDFRLVSPITSRVIRGQTRSALRQDGPGFSWSDNGRRYSTALFNLAAYDGQTVLLTLDFDRRAAQRRGMVNINNLRIAVAPTQTGPAGATIPEPGTVWLMIVAGAFGLVLVPRRGRAFCGEPLRTRLA